MDSPNEQESVFYTSFLNTDSGKKEMYEYSKKKVADTRDPTHYNSLTGLPALRLFFYHAGELVQKNPDGRFGLMVMDIAQFKAVNEFLGRGEGDRLLLFIASCLIDYAENRPHTAIGHIRADNFCLMTEYTDRQELADIATDLRARLAAFPFPYRVIMSIGICASEEKSPAVSFLKDCATIAMNRVKGKYYSEYNFFTDEMRTRMLQEKQIESDIIPAIKNGEIVPFIQPKVDMRDGSIIGGEALVRWIKEDGRIVSPGDFVSVAENNGMIVEVDRYMWEQIFIYQRRLLDAGRRIVPISVNVSRIHGHDRRPFHEKLIKLRDTYDVPPEYVPIELTESAFASGEDETLRRLQLLRQQGFKVSIDDFGSGFSSLNMLRSTEIDEVKLDRVFLFDIDTTKCQIILEHLIAMLHKLELATIVEGVETGQQRDFLVRNGCVAAQGFYFYRPMALSDFDDLIR